MRALLLEPEVALPMTYEMGGASACKRRHWGRRWSSPWGHESHEGCAAMGGADACKRRQRGRRWSSPLGHEPCVGCADIGFRGRMLTSPPGP